MKAGGAKAKGNAAESVVMRALREFFPDSHRSIGSGNSWHVDDQGDVVAGSYLVEVKHHASFSRPELQRYWLKVIKEAEGAKKFPLLVYKENRKDARVRFFANMTLSLDDRAVEMYFDDFCDAIREGVELRGKN